MLLHYSSFIFFFNDTATTEIYTLSLHDALPISCGYSGCARYFKAVRKDRQYQGTDGLRCCMDRQLHLRSEEHTSELQSRPHLVCRLLLEKKKKNEDSHYISVSTISNLQKGIALS